MFSLETLFFKTFCIQKVNSATKSCGLPKIITRVTLKSPLKIPCRNFQQNTFLFTDFNFSSIESEFQNFTDRMYRHPGSGHSILLIQPRNRENLQTDTPEKCKYKLDEAAALVNSLKNWRVKQKHIIPTSSIKSKLVFGTGNLEKIKQLIQTDPTVTAVFIGIDILTALQASTLERYFKLPVFDRYQIILQIFHDHAHTKEAKLQLALAEIPYLKVKLAALRHTKFTNNFSEIHYVGGAGETFMETRRRLLNERELKLKKVLEKIKGQREFLRQSEQRSAHPVIAVVGYTNCGKTSLIKALTNDDKLLPQDKLFATLDVTLHAGLLPSNQKVLFIDTVGFISDVPTALIQSFKATLEEITLADLVLHVRDICHPDTEAQKITVLKTLEELNLPQKLLDSVVEVKNKVDKLERLPEERDSGDLYISATNGTGLPELLEVVEQKLFESTGHMAVLIRVPNGGEEYRWLMKEAAIREAIADPRDGSFLILEVILSKANLAKFKHRFGDLTTSVEEIMKA